MILSFYSHGLEDLNAMRIELVRYSVLRDALNRLALLVLASGVHVLVGGTRLVPKDRSCAPARNTTSANQCQSVSISVS